MSHSRTRLAAPFAASMILLLLLLLGASQAQARISVSPNFRMDTPLIPGRTLDSVGLAVDPRNQQHIVEVNANWEIGQCEHHVSFNGGRTWTGGSFHAPADFGGQPCAVGPHLAENMMQGVVYGSGNNVYATFSSPRVGAADVDAGKSLFVAISRDGGRNWGVAHEVAVGGPTSSPGPSYTLPTIGVDPARRGGPRHDIVYVAADTTSPAHTNPPLAPTSSPPPTEEDIAMSVSKDAGRTWGPVFNVNAPGTTAAEQTQPVIGRDGSVYIGWRDIGTGSGLAAANGFVIVAKSRNHGATWTRVKTAVVQGYIYNGPPMAPYTVVPAVYTSSTFPRLAIDRSRNMLYLVFGQGPPLVPYVPGHPSAVARAADHFINPHSEVWFQRSNGDRSWSEPKRINGASPLGTNPTQTRHPDVSVAPNGRVDIVWQDRRNWYNACTNTHEICNEARLGDTYYAYSLNHGRSFSRNYRLTDRSMNNDVGLDYRFGAYWAYGPQAVALGNNTLLVAWMDARMGNFQNDNADIYMTRVSLNATGPVPVRRVRAGSATAFSLELARLTYPGGPEAVLGGTFVSRPWVRVVIVNDQDAAGALAGGVLARAYLAPVLASPASGLPLAVKREVSLMQPVGAYVIGSTSQLSDQVVSDLVSAGVPSDQITRLAGASAAGTAAEVATAAADVDQLPPPQVPPGQPEVNAAIIANPASADAFTAAALAAARRLPILYVSRDAIPPETTAALAQMKVTRTLVVGGPGVVGGGVVSQLPSPTRLSGANAYGTSIAVARAAVLWGLPDNIVYVTNGRDRMQTALLGGALGRINASLLVSPLGAVTAQRTIARTYPLRQDVTQIMAIK